MLVPPLPVRPGQAHIGPEKKHCHCQQLMCKKQCFTVLPWKSLTGRPTSTPSAPRAKACSGPHSVGQYT